MRRFHVHVGVADLNSSIRFYSALFGTGPTVRKDDYAKWMIDDPRVNFAISQRGHTGVDHLGLQAESADELSAIRERFAAADRDSLRDEPGVKCCYAHSDKHWVVDPQGIAWEGYRTMGEFRYFSGDEQTAQSACCAKDEADARNQQSSGCCVQAQVDTMLEQASACCAQPERASSAQSRTSCCAK
jgi:hypothetical protein